MSLSDEDVANIYRRSSDVVYRRCLAMLGSREAAKDAVQDIFVKVLTKRLTFKGDCDPMTWIYRITTNHVLNQLRDRRSTTSIDELPLMLHPRWEGPEGQVISRDALRAVFRDIDDRSRAILFLHFVDGLDQKEVAKTLGVSRRAVVKRLTRLRATLQTRGDV